MQRLSVDYDETFNLVVKPATIRTVLSLVVSPSWHVHQLDVKNAFLHDTHSETVYCSQPTVFVDSAQLDHVCLLNKSLYGLKQVPHLCTAGSPRISPPWDLLRSSLTPPYSSFGMAQIRYTCCFTLMTLSSPYPAHHFCSRPYLPLSRNSPWTSDPSIIFEVSIQHQADGLCLTERQFALDILERAGMVDCKLVSTPMDTQVKVSAEFEPPFADPTHFRSLAGALQYLMSPALTSPMPSSWSASTCMIPGSLTSPS
jgi:hypothetical protein